MIGLRWPAPPPGSEGVVTDLWIEEVEFEAWVRSGRIGPDTLVGPVN